ncbi:hypothetical protein Btru_057942 [Bulinus truncatus]|nr:hypothetical protein Btru_057942 [Bulinus truncatus]
MVDHNTLKRTPLSGFAFEPTPDSHIGSFEEMNATKLIYVGDLFGEPESSGKPSGTTKKQPCQMTMFLTNEEEKRILRQAKPESICGNTMTEKRRTTLSEKQLDKPEELLVTSLDEDQEKFNRDFHEALTAVVDRGLIEAQFLGDNISSVANVQICLGEPPGGYPEPFCTMMINDEMAVRQWKGFIHTFQSTRRYCQAAHLWTDIVGGQVCLGLLCGDIINSLVITPVNLYFFNMSDLYGENVGEVWLPEQREFGDEVFPLVLSPKQDSKNRILTSQDASDWLKKNSAVIQAELLKYGAILFRGFPLNDAQDFDEFVTSYGVEPLPYVGGAAPRKQITSKVFTANEAPPSEPIPFHHEMAQVPTSPSVLFFYCDVAPQTGGQTPLVLSNLVYEAMREKYPQFIRDLEDKKVQYCRVLPEEDDPSSPIGRGWKSTFLTDDKAEAERKCQEQGTSFEWLPNGCLKTITAVLPAIRQNIRTGKKVWFNSIIAAYKGWKDVRNCPEQAVTFSDGTPMPQDIMEDLERTLDQLAVEITWQKGDIMLVDNNQILHARRPFTPPRRILASLGK